jgi:hypothetical protein
MAYIAPDHDLLLSEIACSIVPFVSSLSATFLLVRHRTKSLCREYSGMGTSKLSAEPEIDLFEMS